jgi:Tfp pilus assembly protein PilO
MQKGSLMDWQLIINIVAIVASICGAVIGWFVNVIWSAQKELRQDLHSIEKDLPERYVKKDELQEIIRNIKDERRDDMREIKDLFRQIFDKLDNKADK